MGGLPRRPPKHLVHYTLSPSRRRFGFPVLTQAEGLKPELLPAYNAVLYAWALAALTSLAIETPHGARKWDMVGMLAAVPLGFSARHHFAWIKERALETPAWWNRALVASPSPVE